ncbi:helix-turn-helix domain-containing protein [Methylomagnum ishizawai]|uniref:helix-turn-helix domain-containing protein n=1 Tax=Methylomagnum ishizawai TaxID=1760988 RepID=UPI001C33F14E|nr:helix-turn-helix domain-containing protein [Methylomagnum ishizawai]BBL77462.1 hypothetical protein MishRS11D_45600 [Methylomagnum ishizawai]
MNAAAILDLFGPPAPAIGPREHFDTVHGGHSTKVAYLSIPIEGKPHERTFPPEETRFVMEMAPGFDRMDLYFSQSGFHHRRMLGQVAALPTLWVDLDFYKDPRLKRVGPMELLDRAQARYPTLPMPTLVISSGRGAYFEWVFDKPLPPTNLAQWQQVMDCLIAMFKDFGADPACRDATRVLRIVGGTNQKNRREVTGYRTGIPVAFDEIRRAVLGYAGTLRAIETPKAAPDHKETGNRKPSPTAKETLGHANQSETSTPKPTSQEQTRKLSEKQAKSLLGPYLLHRARLSDYETLAKLRGGKLKDCRSRMLFAVATSLTWYIGDENRLKVELRDFAQEHFLNPKKYEASRVKAVIDRLKLDQGGIVIPVWEGRRVPNRYRMTNAYLLKLLEVTPEEEKKLTTIIGTEEKAQRRRHKAGAMSREEYEARAQEKRERIKGLSAEGLRQAEIAKTVEVHRQQVHQTLKTGGRPEYKERTFDNASPNVSSDVSSLRAAGLSQRAIAAALGIHQSTVSRILASQSEARQATEGTGIVTEE